MPGLPIESLRVQSYSVPTETPESDGTLAFAERFDAYGVRWFEEPVSSDDLEGLRLMRERGPAGMAISADEYGDRLPYFRRMLDARAVDTLQADAARYGGVTGFMACAALCEAYGVPLSSHCAPALHAPLCCAAKPALHLEYFQDHVRIERLIKTADEEALLERIGVQARLLDSGCCGMAGSFGFEREKYEVSMRCAERTLLPMVRASSDDTLIIANGFSCREQIVQATGRMPLHLAQVLHLAIEPPVKKR